MLKKIELKNFRSFGQCNIDLNNINLLIGGNGSGKSNFISLFKLLNYIGDARLELWIAEKGGFDNIVYRGIQENNSIDIKFYFDTEDHKNLNIYFLKLKATEDDYVIVDESVGIWDDRKFADPNMKSIIKILSKESNLKNSVRNNPFTYYISRIIKKWKIYHFDDVSPNSNKKREQRIDDGYILDEEGDNIAAFLYNLKKDHFQNYRKVVEVVSMVAPYFDDFILEPETSNEELIKLKWTEKDSVKEFRAALISDGTLRFICLSALLLQPYLPEVIIIDEPELGLHPLAITILSELVKKASVKSQIIMATQSVTLLNNFKPEDVIVIDKEKEGSSIKRLDRETLSGWLDEYTLGELWEGNYIGGRY